MRKIRVEEAVGKVLAYDLTKAVPGEYKDTPFKKGHIVQQQDIEILKNMGKYHIFVLTLGENELDEEEAALRIGKSAKGEGLYMTAPSEGKVFIKARHRGLLKVQKKAIEEINDIEMVVLSTLHENTLVEQDQNVAGAKVIPLVIEKEKLQQVEQICQHYPFILEVKPLQTLRVGIVVTGSEVFYGRIQDKFAPVLQQKIEALGGTCIKTLFTPDDIQQIHVCITELLEMGAELIMVSGGMAVDADDVTPKAIERTAEEVVSYGSPVLPGAMFMVAYANEVPILGIPACGMVSKTTVLDVVLPRIFAKEKVTKKEIVSLAHGGLCLGCDICGYPICPLGK